MEEEVKSFGEYLDVFRRRKYWVIFPTLVLMALSIAIAYWLPATYKSEGLILIESQEIPNDLVRSTVTSYADQRIAVIEKRLMTTSKILEVIKRHNLYIDLEKNNPTSSRLVNLFRTNVEVKMVTATVTDPRSGRSKRASIAFTVSFLDKSPETAQIVANELVTAFLDENVRVRTDRAAQTKNFLKIEGDKLQIKLQKIEEKIGEFKDQYSDSLPELLQYNLSAVERFQGELRKNQDSILAIKDQITTMSLQLSSIPVYLESRPEMIEASENGPTKEMQITELRSQYNSLIIKYSQNHPDIIRLKRQIESLESELDEKPISAPTTPEVEKLVNPVYAEINGRISSAENEISRIRAMNTDTKSKLADFESRIFKTHQVKRIYDDLTRDHDNTQKKYRELRAKETEAELAENLEVENKGESFSLIEPPLVPKNAEKPNRKKLVMAGFVFSFGAGLGIALLIEMLFGGVRGYDKVTAIAGRAPLVVVPIIKTKLDIRRQNTYRKRWLLFLVMLCLAAVTVFHYYVMNLEVFWFKLINKISNI